MKVKNKKPITGTLYIALFATIAAPFLTLNSFRSTILPFSFNETWMAISDKTLETFNPQWMNLVYFEFTCNIILFIYTVLLVVLFIQKRRKYATYIIVYFIAKIVFITFIMYFQTVIKGPPTPTMSQITGIAFRSLLFTGMWVPYFLLSEKVRETFLY